jgi:CRP/FNR family transcriptional regulator, cyclic AMP receptor protein
MLRAMTDGLERSLGEVSLFRTVPEASLRSIEQRCTWRKFQSHEQIIDYQDSSRDVFFLVSGRARVIIYSVEGQAVAFRELVAGDVFGELSAIDGRTRSASVEAKAPCLIASMSPNMFLEAIAEEGQLALALSTHLVTQIRDLTDRIFEFSTLAVKNRIHAELLRLARRAAPDANKAALAPPPTHAEIASRISTHREAVSRELSRLAQIGLVRREGSSLLVTDIERLEEMVREAVGEE